MFPKVAYIQKGLAQKIVMMAKGNLWLATIILMWYKNNEKNNPYPSFSNQIWGVWKWDETLFWVFDIASQTLNILGENQSKISLILW